MPVSTTSAVERVARVLAGLKHSRNADGTEAHASDSVEVEWSRCVDNALAVLRTLREPDKEMAAVGDVGTWERMIAAAIGEPAEAESEPFATPDAEA